MSDQDQPPSYWFHILGGSIPFSVKLSPSEFISAVKHHLVTGHHDSALEGRNSNDLALYIPSNLSQDPLDDLDGRAQQAQDACTEAKVNKTLSQLYPEGPPPGHIHFLIRINEQWRENIATKREHPETAIEANKRIRVELTEAPMLTPSTIAVPSEFARHYRLQSSPRLKICRPESNQNPLPLVLVHPVFANFVSDCKTFSPTPQDFQFILKLSSSMSGFFEDERARAEEFRRCLSDYGIELAAAQVDGTPGFLTDGDARSGRHLFLITEAKKDFGAASSDPYIQAGAYHLANIQKEGQRTFRQLPCMHIFYQGPVIGFSGSILTETFDMNVFGPILPLFTHRTDTDSKITAAKMFGALKRAYTALQAYYVSPEPQSPPDGRFPWITEYHPISDSERTHELKYIEQIKGGGLLFLCEDLQEGKHVIVKFVQTYCPEAHSACATAEAAPALLGFVEVTRSCGWSCVVMEWLRQDEWKSALMIREAEGLRLVQEEVKKHLSSLHLKGFVHGDIRLQNVLVKRDADNQSFSVRLVDFDWAGRIGTARYPLSLNPDLGRGIERPGEIVGDGLIKPEHDLDMLNLFPRFLTVS